jgi:hypothetical protein
MRPGQACKQPGRLAAGRLESRAHADDQVAARQRRLVLQHRSGEADVLVQQVAGEQEPGDVVAAQALGIGQVRIQLGVAGRGAGLEAGQAVLAQRPQQRGAAAPRTLPVIDVDAEAAGRLQRQIAGVFQPAARGVGEQPARPAGAALVVADLGFGAAYRRIALAEDALV